MENHQDKLRHLTIILLCGLNIGFGLRGAQMPMVLAGAVGLVYVAAMTLGSRARPSGAIQVPLS
jgi:hypothetical protein